MAPSTDDRWRLADALLDRALDLPSSERHAFIARECGPDHELREQVERLLGHLETDRSFLTPGGALAAGLPDLLDDAPGGAGDAGPDRTGATIDRYRILRELGRGGMAIVYLAERADGQFEHQVALKLIRGGAVDREEVIRRFARERQIMARASHPNMARLLDGGATAEGQPYFVMEYVDGLSIDRYSDRQRLNVDERLRLFLRVADAVAYAHRNLVIHRDIKPANILVTASGDVKLLDFGIAKLLGDEHDEDATLTRTGTRPMTPAFASPEQIRGAGVTTATDIYQLGLLMYVLLAGREPYPTRGRGPLEMQRAILEQPVTRPSLVVAQADRPATFGEAVAPDALARARRSTASQLRRTLEGDLDNIILKALRKEPDRRYPSVGQLMEDVERYLQGRPVTARPDTLGYRASKFIRRHRLTVALASAALTLLVAFAATMTVQAGRIARERDRANREADTAAQVSEFLIGLFEVSDPGEARGGTITARELLDRGAERISGQLEDQPGVRARMLQTIGRVYHNLGLYDSAGPLLSEALAIRRERLDPDDPDLVSSLNALAWLLETRGRYDEAEPLYREALDLGRRLHRPGHPAIASSLNNLGLLLYRKGELDAAEPLLRDSLAMRRGHAETSTDDLADVISNLALVLHRRGDLDRAEGLHREALELRRDGLGADHPKMAISLDNLGRVLFDRKDFDGSERLSRDALAIRRKVFGEEHPQVSESLNNLASLLFMKGDIPGAEETFRQVVALDRKLLGPEHPDLGNSLSNLATIRMRQGRHAEAEPIFLEAIGIFEAALGRRHHMYALGLSNYGECLTHLKRFEEAERRLLEGYEVMVASLGADNRRTIATAGRLADLYDRWGKQQLASRYRQSASPAAR